MANTNTIGPGEMNTPNNNAGADPTAQNTYYSIPAIQRKLKQWYENEVLVKTVTDILKEYEGAEYIVQKGYNTVIIELHFLDSDETPILLINPSEEVTVYSDIATVPRESVLNAFRNVQSSGTNMKVQLKPDFQNRINLQESTFDSGANEPLTAFEESESIRPIDLICSSEINSKDLQNVQSQLPNIVASLAQLRGILSEIDPEKLQEYIDTYDSWILKIENVETLLRTIIENKEEFDEILNSIVASSGGLLGLPSQDVIDAEGWSSAFVGFPTSMNEWLQFFLNLTTATDAALFGKNSVSWRGLFDSDFEDFASPPGQDTYNELYTRLKNDGYFTSSSSITSIDDMETIDGNTLEDWFYESVEKILEDVDIVDSDAHQWYQRFKTLRAQLNSNIDLRSTGGERIIAYQAFLKAIDKIAEENINLDGFLPYIGDTQVFNYPGMETPLDVGLNNAFLYPRENPKLDVSFPNEKTEDHQISNKKYMNAIMLLTYIDTTLELLKGTHVSPPPSPPNETPLDADDIPDTSPVNYGVDGVNSESSSESNTNVDFEGNLAVSYTHLRAHET